MWNSSNLEEKISSVSETEQEKLQNKQINKITEDSQKYKTDSGCITTTESGYISGPLTSSQLIDEDDSIERIPPESSIKFENISKQQQGNLPKEQQILNLDSGCAEDDYFEEETKEDTKDKQKMIIDSNISEWFCNLSIKNQNNLDASSQNNKVTTSASISTAPTSIDYNKLNNFWELCYQQNNDGDTQLHMAATGYIDIVAKLIKISPHPYLFDIQNDEAQSALHIAAITGQPKIIRMLLLAGAQPIIRDRNGNTPLHLACMNGDLQCVKELTMPINASELEEAQRLYLPQINYKDQNNKQHYVRCAQLPTDFEIRNYDGERCVHLAAQGNHIDVLRHLVGFTADINAREGKSGRTPLHIAIEQRNDVLINFLLNECKTILNLETETYSGLTAYQFACINQNQKIQLDLKSYGAEPLTPPDSDLDDSDYDDEMQQIYGISGYFTNQGGIPTISVTKCC